MQPFRSYQNRLLLWFGDTGHRDAAEALDANAHRWQRTELLTKAFKL